jgi:hypothetical protein
MFKTFLAATLLISSGFVYAETIAHEPYLIQFKDKQNKINDVIRLDVDGFPSSGGGIMKEKHKTTDCILEPYDFEMYSASDSFSGITVQTLSQTREIFHIVFTLTYTEDFSTENAIKLNDTCTIANNVSSTIDVQWAGDIQFGEKKTIKLPNNNELYMEVLKDYPEID